MRAPRPPTETSLCDLHETGADQLDIASLGGPRHCRQVLASSPRLIASLAVVALLPCSPALAAPAVVTNTNDAGSGSLRAALATAGNGDVLAVPAGTYLLTTGALQVPAGVTLRGAGARATTLSGNHSSGVLKVTGAGVAITDLTITGGKSADDGGGILATSGLTLRRVAVVGNVSAGWGGGVSAGGAQPLIADHSLFAGNQAAGNGGGLELGFSTGGSRIENSTITGNVASSGGGLFLGGGGLALEGDTLAGNRASAQGGGFRLSASAPLTIRDTVLAGGVAQNGGDCYFGSGAGMTSLGHNAEDTDATPDSACQNALHGPGDRAGLTLRFGDLADHGGPTDTLLPEASGPLIDAGDAQACLADDARGVARPQGGGCDIGAVERGSATIISGFADAITMTSATLHGTVDAFALGGSARFAYGPSGGYGGYSAAGALPAVAGPQPAAETVSGLLPGTTYHFRLEASTPDGPFAGTDMTFTTPAATAAPTPPPAPAAPRVSVVRTRASGTRVLVTLRCTGARCRGTETLVAAGHTVGKAGYDLAAGHTTQLALRLVAAGRRQLARRHRLALRLTLRLRAADGKLTTVTTGRLTMRTHR